MLVLAAVPDVQFHKLRRAAGSRFMVAQVSTWDDVLTGIRSRPVELAVVDPLLSGHARSQEIERLRVLFPSLPLMLYTTLTPRTAGVLLALGQRGIQHAVFANYDDHPSRLREVLGQEEARSSSRQLLDQLADALAPLPSELRWVLEEALCSPGERSASSSTQRSSLGSGASASASWSRSCRDEERASSWPSTSRKDRKSVV